MERVHSEGLYEGKYLFDDVMKEDLGDSVVSQHVKELLKINIK